MKKIIVLLFAFIIFNQIMAQTDEFKTYSNDLIYSNNTMSQLSHIVDSLNLKYKSCDLNKTFRSKSQSVGYFVEINGKEMKAAQQDMKNGISLENFRKKYPKAKVIENMLVVRFEYKDYNDKDVIEFSEMNLESGSGYEIGFSENLKKYRKELKNTWIYDNRERSKKYKYPFQAFYLPKGFSSQPIKEKYARMIGYADCLIDTSTLKINKNAQQGYVNFPTDWEKLSKIKKERLLEKMRNTRVVGSCSQDSSPRNHAINIAQLSAETTNWEVFLRAHLDIMNDRFERASDGSYAWGARKTYIKELEELDINVSDLIFGISLRLENPAKNHYYGSIGRVGRALSETKDHQSIAQAMLNMIEDSELDDYNRVLFYFLFRNYNHYIQNEDLKKENLENLKKSITALPSYLQEKIVLED